MSSCFRLEPQFSRNEIASVKKRIRLVLSTVCAIFSITSAHADASPNLTTNCNGVTGPGITLSSPANGAIFNPPAPRTISLSAVTGPVYSSTSWYADGVFIGSGTGPISWSAPAGNHLIKVVATGSVAGCFVQQTRVASITVMASSIPAVVLTVPTSVSSPGTATLSANVSNTYAISSVTYYANGVSLGTATVSPYSLSWPTKNFGNRSGIAPAGVYTVQARATDIYGEVGSSTNNNVTVVPSNPPVVGVSASVSRSTLPATLLVSATATDPYSIYALSISVNANGVITNYPLTPSNSGSLTLNLPLAGASVGSSTNYSITASAADFWGGAATTSAVAISEAGHAPPNVTLLSANSSFAPPGQITALASASDLDGIASVALYVNGALAKTQSSSPYEFLVQGYAPGTYSVQVIATNTVGQTTASTVQNVTITAPTTVIGDPKTQTRTMAYAYDSTTGLRIESVSEPEDSNLCLVQIDARDAFGHVTSTVHRNCNGSVINSVVSEAAAPSVGSDSIFTQRTTSQVAYETTGTFPWKTTNALGQVVATNTYDPRFSVVTTSVDANGLTTSTSLDAFGRVILETAADGVQSKTIYAYCNGIYGGTTSCPANAVSTVQNFLFASDGTTLVSPTKTIFQDTQLRTILTQTQGLVGEIIETANLFDTFGNEIQTTRPYFASNAPVFSSATFDLLQRIVSQTDLEGNVAYFSYDGTNATTQDFNGHSSVTTVNSQGQVVSVIDAADQLTSFVYDPFGNLVATVDPAGLVKTFVFDLRGRKISSTDPDMGVWKYTYDALGELLSQTDAKNETTRLTYDILGRLLSRVDGEYTSYREYDVSRPECTTGSGAAVGLVDYVYTSAGNSRIECVDALRRPVQERTTIQGSTYVSSLAYDSAGRAASRTFPANSAPSSPLSVAFSYNTYGYLSSISSGSVVIWQANSMNELGSLTSESMAAGAITSTRGFDLNGRVTSIKSAATALVQNDTYGYDAVGNLISRSWIDVGGSHSESFAYDALDRLSSVVGPASKAYQYDLAGNLTAKSDVGTYSYMLGTHRISSISGVVNGVSNPISSFDANGDLLTFAGVTTSWTSFGKPASISKGTSKSAFSYGAQHERLQQISTTGSVSVTTNYIGSDFEAVFNSSTNAWEYHSFISAGGRRVAMLIEKGGSTYWRYFHQDNLGSVEVVTDQTGAIIERLSYDAWGKRRNTDGTDALAAIVALDTRGFTDQEELDSIGLVNMNGRVYDPVVGRFISADPYITELKNLQSHNRYSYVLNRPLSMVDPTGYFSNSLYKFLASFIGTGLLQDASFGVIHSRDGGTNAPTIVIVDSSGNVVAFQKRSATAAPAFVFLAADVQVNQETGALTFASANPDIATAPSASPPTGSIAGTSAAAKAPATNEGASASDNWADAAPQVAMGNGNSPNSQTSVVFKNQELEPIFVTASNPIDQPLYEWVGEYRVVACAFEGGCGLRDAAFITASMIVPGLFKLGSVAAKGAGIVLGKSIGLEARAAAIGGTHLMGEANWQGAVLKAIADPSAQLSVDIAGLEGSGSAASRVMAAIQRDASGAGSPFDWELSQLWQSGRMATVNFFEDANAIANPFR